MHEAGRIEIEFVAFVLIEIVKKIHRVGGRQRRRSRERDEVRERKRERREEKQERERERER